MCTRTGKGTVPQSPARPGEGRAGVGGGWRGSYSALSAQKRGGNAAGAGVAVEPVSGWGGGGPALALETRLFFVFSVK